jgi:hypothetical protein
LYVCTHGSPYKELVDATIHVCRPWHSRVMIGRGLFVEHLVVLILEWGHVVRSVRPYVALEIFKTLLLGHLKMDFLPSHTTSRSICGAKMYKNIHIWKHYFSKISVWPLSWSQIIYFYPDILEKSKENQDHMK